MIGFRGIAVCAVSGLLALALVSGTAGAQESASASLVNELTEAMESAGLDSIAARHASVREQFVAALLFGGRQLLVVSARYEEPSLLVTALREKNYRDIYSDLQTASYSIQESKVFVDDLGANGLRARPGDGEPFDTFTDASGSTPFDGDWMRQSLSETDYTEAFDAAERSYTEMLELLIAEAKGSS